MIRRNIATLRFEDRATVAPIDVYRWLRGYSPLDAEPVVVFLDPPYAEYRNHPDRFHRGLTGLLAAVPPGSTIVVEGPERLPPELLPDPDAWDVRRYGGTLVAFRTVGEADEPPENAMTHQY